MVNDFDRFMTSEGTTTFILAFTLKTGQSVAKSKKRGLKIFYLEFSVLQRIHLSIFGLISDYRLKGYSR